MLRGPSAQRSPVRRHRRAAQRADYSSRSGELAASLATQSGHRCLIAADATASVFAPLRLERRSRFCPLRRGLAPAHVGRRARIGVCFRTAGQPDGASRRLIRVRCAAFACWNARTSGWAAERRRRPRTASRGGRPLWPCASKARAVREPADLVWPAPGRHDGVRLGGTPRPGSARGRIGGPLARGLITQGSPDQRPSQPTAGAAAKSSRGDSVAMRYVLCPFLQSRDGGIKNNLTQLMRKIYFNHEDRQGSVKLITLTHETYNPLYKSGESYFSNTGTTLSH